MAELMKSEGDDLYLFLVANALMVKIAGEDVVISQLNRYINQIIEKERETCAEIAESWQHTEAHGGTIAAHIRAR